MAQLLKATLSPPPAKKQYWEWNPSLWIWKANALQRNYTPEPFSQLLFWDTIPLSYPGCLKLAILLFQPPKYLKLQECATYLPCSSALMRSMRQQLRIMLSVTEQYGKGYTLPFIGIFSQIYQVNYIRRYFYIFGF